MQEKDKILSMLPVSVPEEKAKAMIRAAANNDALGKHEFLTFWRESYDGVDDPIGWPFEEREALRHKWAARCRCGACGEEWWAGWKNQSAIYLYEGEDGMLYPGVPDDNSADLQREVDEGDVVNCPMCEAPVALTPRNSLKRGRTYQCMMGEAVNLGQYSAVMYWMLFRYVNRLAESSYEVKPWAAIVVGSDGTPLRFWHARCQYFGKRMYVDNWFYSSSSGEPINSRYYSWEACNCTMVGGFYLTDVPDQRGMTAEKTGLADYLTAGGEFPLKYLLRQKRYPYLENLVRAGWTFTIDSAIAFEISSNTSSSIPRIADIKKPRPHDMLKMTRAEVARFGRKRWEREKALIWMMYDWGDPSLFESMVGKYGIYELDTAMSEYGLQTMLRIDSYLVRQSKLGQAHPSSSGLSMYMDYREMLGQLDGGNTEIELFPPRLRQAHDRLMVQRDAAENKTYNKAFEVIRRKWAALEWSDGKICAVLPRSGVDLTIEGQTLNHCVGGYCQNHVEGKLILFIRHARRPERSWFTLNVDVSGSAWRRIQLHGYGNEHAHGKQLHIPREVYAFVERWEREILTPVFDRVKAAEKKQKAKSKKGASAA